MRGRYPDAEKGAHNLRLNRIWLARAENLDKEETDHNPPSQGHYTATYDWDEAAADYVSATAALEGGRDGLYYERAAKRGLAVLTAGIDDDGFLPNYRYIGAPRRFDPEMVLAFGRGATRSNYTQPPLLALSVHQTYDAATFLDDDPQQFLNSMYPKLAQHYDYFDRELRNSTDDPLTGVYHPHMTGRDSDPTFDSLKPLRIPRIGMNTPRVIDKLNVPIDYVSILRHGVRLRRAGDNIEQWRKVHWTNDVMMNCIYVDNLREMAELAGKKLLIFDTMKYDKLAGEVEQQILGKMWFPEARGGKGAFMALDKNGEPITEISISNLFPLTLSNLREEQLESILNLMRESFNVPFPLPSVATDSPNFDPHNRESWRLWRGPKWMITDWYLVERGLWRQAERTDIDRSLAFRCADWARRIARQSHSVVEKEGPREHYDPYTGKGQRKAVVNFGWSNLAYVMTKDK